MNALLTVMQNGFSALPHPYGLALEDVALLANRFALGFFFLFSGYHKLFNKSRHASLVATLQSCGVPDLTVMQWFVPCVEFFGGLSLISGILSPFASLGLIAVCVVAVATDGLKRVRSYAPIDKADYCDDVLYLPEVLYIVGLLVVMAFGATKYSLLSLVM